MKRRTFIGLSSAGAASLWTGMNSCGVPATKTFPLGPSAQSRHAPLPTDEYNKETLATAELHQLRSQHEYDLYEDFLPFMEKYIIDHENGGFMCTTDRDGTRISTDKSQWYEGRGIWVYSYLYNNL
jgi:N-acylglucosamine 2-epimerase